MADFFAGFFDWMEAVPPLWAYLAILVIAYGENVLPPIPGDMVVVFGGYLVGVGKLSFGMVVFLSTLGGALGFMTMYAIGRGIGEAVFDPDRLQWLPKAQIHRAREWLGRWGYGVVAANRFLSGFRSVISVTVGMARMNAWATAAYATLSALVWTLLISYGGYAVGENWEVIGRYLKQYGMVVLGLLVVFLLVQGLRFLRKRRQGDK